MNILQLLSEPWAIQPQALEQLHSIYLAHMRGDIVDLAAIEARIGRPLNSERVPYQVQDGVALVPVTGPMAPKMNMFSAISGGTSTQLIAQDIRTAEADPTVHATILPVDSPGGSVLGLDALANTIEASGKVKPIYTLAEGTMASAAYYIGAAAGPGHVFMSDPHSEVGSIGVVMKHVDVSGAEAKDGVKTTEITAGKYKRIASSYAPLTDDGQAHLQDRVDYQYSLFVDRVAKSRGVSSKTVLKDMADGRLFTGQQAVDAGLVDGITSLDGLITKINADLAPSKSAPSSRTTPGASMPITREQIAAEAPELLASIQTEAASAERDRIKAVRAQALPGHDAVIEALMFDGKSTGGDAAMAMVAAERTARANHVTKMNADLPPLLPSAPVTTPAPGGSGEKSKAERVAEAKAYQQSHGVDFETAAKAVGAWF